MHPLKAVAFDLLSMKRLFVAELWVDDAHPMDRARAAANRKLAWMRHKRFASGIRRLQCVGWAPSSEVMRTALELPDILGHVIQQSGLAFMANGAAVCTSWCTAAGRKLDEWRHLRSIGTRLCMTPAASAGSTHKLAQPIMAMSALSDGRVLTLRLEAVDAYQCVEASLSRVGDRGRGGDDALAHQGTLLWAGAYEHFQGMAVAGEWAFVSKRGKTSSIVKLSSVSGECLQTLPIETWSLWPCWRMLAQVSCVDHGEIMIAAGGSFHGPAHRFNSGQRETSQAVQLIGFSKGDEETQMKMLDVFGVGGRMLAIAAHGSTLYLLRESVEAFEVRWSEGDKCVLLSRVRSFGSFEPPRGWLHRRSELVECTYAMATTGSGLLLVGFAGLDLEGGGESHLEVYSPRGARLQRIDYEGVSFDSLCVGSSRVYACGKLVHASEGQGQEFEALTVCELRDGQHAQRGPPAEFDECSMQERIEREITREATRECERDEIAAHPERYKLRVWDDTGGCFIDDPEGRVRPCNCLACSWQGPSGILRLHNALLHAAAPLCSCSLCSTSSSQCWPNSQSARFARAARHHLQAHGWHLTGSSFSSVGRGDKTSAAAAAGRFVRW